MQIPKSFILHGQLINVRVVDKLDSNSFGTYNDAKEEITIARTVKDGDGIVELTQDQINHTFFHELIHAFQWHAKGEYDEAEAQSYAGLMMEFIKTSGIKINPHVVQEAEIYTE